MSGSSSVGTASTHGAGDQRNHPDSEKGEEHAVPYEEGKEHSHKDNDSSACLELIILNTTSEAQRHPIIHVHHPPPLAAG